MPSFSRVSLFLFAWLALSAYVNRASAIGQADTISVMTYNALNYGFPATTACPLLQTAAKHEYLKTILRYTNPDIVALLKMNADPATFSTDTVVHVVLDSVCDGCYYHALFTNNSGYVKENMLYFRNDKFGYVNSTVIYAADPNISDITLHRLFYKYPDGTAGTDSILLNIIVAHLKSGAGNEQNRTDEVQGALTWLQSNVTAPGNYLLMGDLNTQSSTESCYQLLINNSNPNIRFIDPLNRPGNWAANPSNYASILTSDTRTSDPGDCGASNGMGMRYQHILATAPIMMGVNRIQYVAGSYTTIGQDGQHTGHALIDAPMNLSVPQDVNQALYSMSNHLPVSLRLAIDTSSLNTRIADEQKVWMECNTLFNQVLKLVIHGRAIGDESYTISVIDMAGNEHIRFERPSDEIVQLNTEHLTEGFYLLKLSTPSGLRQCIKIIKMQR